MSWSQITGYDMLLSHQCKGRTGWGGAVIQWSFANEFWIWWRRGAALRTSRGTLGSVTKRFTAGVAKIGSTRGLRPASHLPSALSLLSARRRIHELETELAIHRRAAELLK